MTEKTVAEPKRYQINPDFILREIAGEAVIVCVGDDVRFNHAMISPNGTAAYIWNAFTTPSTEDEAVAKAEAEYDAPEQVILGGVRSFMRDTLAYNVLLEVE